MTRTEHIAEGVALHMGDCREILPVVGSVDHVITDPPYAARTHEMAKTNRGLGHGNKLVTFDALSDAEFRQIASMCLSVARGWVVATCDYRHAALMYDSEKFIRLGAWVKPNPMPQISADRPGQGFEAVLILHSGKIPKTWNRGGGAGTWTVPVINDAAVPTQKPLALISGFVSDFTARGDLVADPFMGSGTTGVACAKAGRRFVGIEADPARFEVALRRVTEALRQPDLFIEKPVPAVPLELQFDTTGR